MKKLSLDSDITTAEKKVSAVFGEEHWKKFTGEYTEGTPRADPVIYIQI